MKVLLTLILSLSLSFSLQAQMEIDGNLLFGNEWIDYSKQYYKFKISEDGIYRITVGELRSSGLDVDQISGADFQIFNFGKEIFISVSNDGALTDSDYIEFYAEKNRGDLDNHLHRNYTNQQLNLEYSLYTDDNVYFLTWDANGNNKRYETINNDLSGTLPSVEAFYVHEEKAVFSDFHYSPVLDGQNVRFSHFNTCEGYGTDITVRTEVVFEANHISPIGPDPYVVLRVGCNNVPHRLEFSINEEIKFFDEFFGLKVEDYRMDMTKDELRATNNAFVKGRGGTNNSIDKNIVGHGSLFYARSFDANDANIFDFKLSATPVSKYIELEGFDAGANNIVYDLTSGIRLNAELEGNTLKFLLPSSLEERRIIVFNENEAIKGVGAVESLAPFIDFSSVNPEYVILTSSGLNSGSAIQDYADFRSSGLGGNLNSYIVEYEQLRDQFGYGIDFHPIGISNFAQFSKPNWTELKYYFIIGKSLEYQIIRENVNTSFISHVPTHGDPGSDHLLFADENDPFSYIPVGRLAANNEQDVINYLEKSIAYTESKYNKQTIADKSWSKRVIHLAGGDPKLQDQLFGHLADMALIIEDSEMAADVITFQKVSNSPTQNPLSEQILSAINDGASVVTFFGHSSAGTFDFSIEDPSKYDNADNLPFIVSLGCHSGNIHTSSSNPIGISESFVLQKETGAIAFLASSGAAYVDPQYQSGKILYDQIGNKLYGGTIGEFVHASLKKGFTDIQINANQFYRVESLLEQLTLHGDPATQFIFNDGPDFIVDFSSIETTPKEITTNLDSFNVDFDVVNLGKYYDGILNGIAIHEYNNGDRDTVDFSLIAPRTSTSVSVQFEQKGVASLGKNLIEIILDNDNDISELPDPEAENNNSIKSAYAEEGYCFFIFDNNAQPIYPREFAIVNDPDIRLISSTNNALLANLQFEIQIDTTELFNSSLLKSNIFNSGGGMIEWKPEISPIDNTVYYWRIRNVSDSNPDESSWNYSSFIYLSNSSEGWNQSHFYQWRKDDLTNSEIDEFSRVFEFEDDFKSVAITNGSWPDCKPLVVYQNEASEFIEWDAPVNAGVWIMVFDEFSGEPWRNHPGGLFNSTMNTSWAIDFMPFPYWTRNADERKLPIEFLENTIPDGAYVAFMTIQYENTSYMPEDWASDLATNGNSLFNVLENQGAQRIKDLESIGSTPYLFVYKKNDPSFDPIEVLGTSSSCFTRDLQISAKWHEGSIESRTIGPVADWESLEWELGDIGITDTMTLSIIGIDNNGMETTLIDEVTEPVLSLDFIEADQYPQIRLKFEAEDSAQRTAPYLNYWRVRYKELPEAVLNTNDDFAFNKDTLGRGQTLSLKAIAENIRDIDMDSLLVRYTIVDNNNNEEIADQRLEPLLGKEQIPIDFEKSTQNMAGDYSLRIEINAAKEQKEEHYFNNLGVINFFVRDDSVNPLLDVTFDGVHIFNGDIISPEPMICVTLRDDAGILLDNPEDFELILELPDGSFETIDVLGPEISFYPPDSSGKNEAKLVYNPSLESGEYTLLVQAKDKSGNFSGDQNLAYSFKVITESKISNILNYPNPFSTSTQFVFTITGYTVPENFHIKIFTLSGKVVREITADELGPLNIGLNRSRYKWDGFDEFGSRLANGVYLYKAYSSFDQEEDSHFDIDGIDQYFKKGFGKMVIIR